MKRAIILVLLLTTAVHSQQRNFAVDAAIPTPVPVPDSSAALGTVTLALAEYNRLVELATRKPKTDDAAPLPFVLSRAAFKLRVQEQSLLGSVDIDGNVLEKGSIKVPLTNGLTILEAQQAGKPLPLLQEGPIHATVINGPGAFAVSLNLASALTVEAGRASFIVPVPPATKRTTENGHTIVEATLEPGKPARVWWTTREIAAPVAQREVRFLSDIKTVVSIGDSQLRVTALCDLTVIQGEAAEFRMPLPAGFELTEATGGTLDSSETENGVLVLRVREPGKRNHQFLVAIERANSDTKADAPLLSFAGAQHETGELLVEGVGAMELTPAESGGLRRIDVREAGAIARSLARFPLQAAFRYNRRSGDTPKLQLEWRQFPDSQVLSAVAERATITTLVNVEGKWLTEVTLRVRNHSQPFVRVQLPAGSTLLSAEVEGERVKPVLGSDGSRVPLLRAGFNPSGAYSVSFVYLSSGAPFAKAGPYAMALPKLDIPVNVLTWEVSLPDRFEVKQFAGNALAAELFPAAAQNFATNTDDSDKDQADVWSNVNFGSLEAGEIGGIVADPNGAVVPGAVVTITNTQTNFSTTAHSNAEGMWVVSGVQPGAVRVTVDSPGFKRVQHELEVTVSQPGRLRTTLDPANVSEVVTVQAENFKLDGLTTRKIEDLARRGRAAQVAQLNAPSQNVFSLQRKVAGILPVRVEVPRSGKSYRFVRPLVLDEETTITFQYKTGK
jgi:hypothetical protein